MAHLRSRSLAKTIKKELRFWPVVCVLGPRQCGKSTLLRDLLLAPGQGCYRSLDPAAVRARAESSPELFLRDVDSWPLLLDEAHKVPVLFDEIKSLVDQSRRPGQFVLSGSVRFSSRVGIRESLTGRAAVLRLDPMTLAETTTKPRTLAEITRYMKKGGMPGVCFLRDKGVEHSYWEQWLDTTCERDLAQIGKGRLSGSLARLIVEQTCRLAIPSQANIARELRVDGRRVASHVAALMDVFVLREVPPHQLGVGKSIFLPFDAGMAHHMGAGLRRCWQSWFLNERLNARRFLGEAIPKMPSYYLTTRGSHVDFVDDEGFHLFTDRPAPDRSELMTMRALAKRVKATLLIHCATDASAYAIDNQLRAVPWSHILPR